MSTPQLTNITSKLGSLSLHTVDAVNYADQWFDNEDTRCPCWVSEEYPYCRANCVLQLSAEYAKICQCNKTETVQAVTAAECAQCLRELRSKRFLVRALTLECDCDPVYEYKVSSRKSHRHLRFTRINKTVLARECKKCISRVHKLLEIGQYPACICKDKKSTEIYHCRPFCSWQVNAIYNDWSQCLPPVTIWKKADQQVLPTCPCWEPHIRASCTDDCSTQLSEICKELYAESCPCNPRAVHRIADEFCWVVRCRRCAPLALKNGEDSGPLCSRKRSA
jgi:hypothetical protein